MKTLSYGDEIENAEVGTSNLELLISDDKLSANSVNRILQNLYEDNEYNYTLIQNLIKNIYGREDGILPNVLEEFKEIRILESGTGKSYFRVPFGGINIMQPHYKDNGLSHGLSYSGEEGSDEKKIVNSEFIDDGFDTYTIFNKPKLGLAKRQIADYINLDIADLDNNIKIYAKKFDNPYQVGNSLIYRVADSSQGRAEIEAFGKDGGRNVLDQSVEDSETPFSNTLDKLKYPFVGYYVSITENTVGAIDSEIYKANTESSNFPNLKKDTTWVIVFKEKFHTVTDAENYPISISFKEMIKNGDNVSYRDVSSYLPAISTFIDASDTGNQEDQINTIVSDINVSYKDYYYAEKINVEIGDADATVSYPALSITSKINYIDLTDKVRVSLDGSNPIDGDGAFKGYYYNNSFINHFIKTEKAKYQNYYYDSISLLTGIFSKYSSYVVNENLSKKEFSLEETIEVPQPGTLELGKEYQYYIYLNMDLDEKYDTGSARQNKNVSTSKMFGAVLCDNINEKFTNTDIYKYVIKKDLRSKPIALFRVFVKFRKNDSGTTGIEITRQELLKPLLDPNKINTRRADLNKLIVDTNTKIQNQFYYSDKGVNNYRVSDRSDVNVIDENGNALEEKAPIDWIANPEMHKNSNAGIKNGTEETRAIKACVSEDRISFSDVKDDNTNEAIAVGIDDVIETFAPYIYNHSQDGLTKEVIANVYGKRIKLLKDRKLRIEQQQSSGNYNDLNLFEITDNGLLFKRHEGTETIDGTTSYKVKNYLELKNTSENVVTSEIKARDTGILFSTDVYKSDEGELDENEKPVDKNNYFKLYANDNKTWIKGVSGKLEIAANKVFKDKADIVLENEPIHYYDFSAIYANELSTGGVSGDDNNDKTPIDTKDNGKGSKYLRLLGNFIIGDKTENESKIINNTPYVAIFNTDTFLKGKLNVTALNDVDNVSNFSSFTIEKDKIFSSNYNDFWLNGNYKAEKNTTEGRYSLRIRNNEGFEFKKIKAGSNNNNAANEASTLRLNDNEVIFTYKDTSVFNGKNHYFRLWKDNAQLYLTDKFINDFSVFTDEDGRKYNRVTFSIDSGTTGGAFILQRKEIGGLSNTKMLANFDMSVVDSDSVYIGGMPLNYQNEDFVNKYSQKKGDLFVSGKTTLGIKNVSKDGETASELKNTLQVYGKTIIGGEKVSSGYNEEGIAIDKNRNPLKYKLFVGGIATLRGNLTVTDATEIHGELIAESNVTLHDDLEVTGVTALESTLNVKSPTYFNCKKDSNGDFIISPGTETVAGKNVYLNDDLVVSNQTAISNSTYVYGITRFNYDKTTGEQTPNTSTTVKGLVDIKDALYVTADATVGTTQAPRELKIYGNAIFNSEFSTNNSYITTVDKNVYIKGQLSNIGTTTVNGVLNIGLSAGESITKNYTAINKDQITVTGNDANDVTKIKGGAITCSYVQTNSSRTKKKNIVHSERDAVKAINDIEIVDFFYKNDKDEKNQKVGFIAEDTDSIFSTNKKDCMDHSNCIGMLLKAVQELSAEIEELKKNR